MISTIGLAAAAPTAFLERATICAVPSSSSVREIWGGRPERHGRVACPLGCLYAPCSVEIWGPASRAACGLCGEGAEVAGKRPDVAWLPTPDGVVDAMLRLADAGPEDVLYDLGSGDGRTAIAAAARFGVREARGVEIRGELLRRSREEARRAGMDGRVRFVAEDLFRADLAGATMVTLYLLPRLNLKLRPRLLGELRPGTRIVSHDFGMGDWDPDRTLRNREIFAGGEVPRAEHRLHLWIVPADAGGTWRLKGPDGEEFGLEVVRRFQKVHGALLLDGGRRVPLRKAKLRGDALSFAVRGVPGLKPKARFEGRVDGEEMSGIFDAGHGSTEACRIWTAERIARQEG